MSLILHLFVILASVNIAGIVVIGLFILIEKLFDTLDGAWLGIFIFELYALALAITAGVGFWLYQTLS